MGELQMTNVFIATTVKLGTSITYFINSLHLLLKYLAYRSETAPVRRTIKVVQKFIIHAIVSHVPLASCVSWCQVQSTPDNSNPRSLEPRANSNQNRLPLDFRHKFIVILPSVTRTLDN